MSTPTATPINPFPAVAAQLSSPEAVAFYKSCALECLYCFGAGLLILIAGTIRTGQILRELIYAGCQVILEINAPVPAAVLALPGAATLPALPAVALPHPDRDRAYRQWSKSVWQQYALSGHDVHDWCDRVLVTPAAPAPKRRRGGRKPSASA
jgi:hypothetical protein